jgi:hypothetical protein
MKQVGGAFVVNSVVASGLAGQWETAAGAPGSREALGGYLFDEAEDLDPAIERGLKIPAARMGGSVEVRPLKEQ